jgi:TPR repeat protein
MEERLTDPLGPALKGPGNGLATVTMCCGKVVCEGCQDSYKQSGLARTGEFPPCPFCRAPGVYYDAFVDNRRMRELLKRRAHQGDPVAMYNLSGSFDAGRHGLPRDFQASICWAALAAMTGGHVRAMNNVAFALRDGEGIAVDHARALPWFRRAAVLEHAGSIWALAKAFRDGLGVTRDLAVASQWLKRGKAKGDAQSARDLARLPPPHGEELSVGGFCDASGMPPEFAEMLRSMRMQQR